MNENRKGFLIYCASVVMILLINFSADFVFDKLQNNLKFLTTDNDSLFLILNFINALFLINAPIVLTIVAIVKRWSSYLDIFFKNIILSTAIWIGSWYFEIHFKGFNNEPLTALLQTFVFLFNSIYCVIFYYNIIRLIKYVINKFNIKATSEFASICNVIFLFLTGYFLPLLSHIAMKKLLIIYLDRVCQPNVRMCGMVEFLILESFIKLLQIILIIMITDYSIKNTTSKKLTDFFSKGHLFCIILIVCFLIDILVNYYCNNLLDILYYNLYISLSINYFFVFMTILIYRIRLKLQH